MAAKLRVTLRKSTVSTTQKARGTVRALGLHRIGQTVEVEDGPTTRGMLRAAQHLVSVEEVGGSKAATSGRHPASKAAAETTEETHP
jgi:large subunit ribosomal protein L30